MSDAAEFPYRLAVGHISVATLEGSNAYLLTAFPVQADQRSIYIIPWGPPSDNSTFPANTRYGQNSDQSQYSDGPINFIWELAYLTENMVAYLEGLLWGGAGMYPDATTQSADVTVKTRRSNGEFAVFQMVALKPIPNQSYRRGDRGVEAYRISFVQGTEITS